MEIAAVTGTEPSPEQFLRKRGKSRSWPPREKGIVYDPAKQSLEIHRIKNIEREGSKSTPETGHTLDYFAAADSNTEYLSCELPSSKIVNVFALNSSTEGGAITEGKDEEDIIFLGRLNLERLGIKDQISRKVGQLRTLYIVKDDFPIE